MGIHSHLSAFTLCKLIRHARTEREDESKLRISTQNGSVSYKHNTILCLLPLHYAVHCIYCVLAVAWLVHAVLKLHIFDAALVQFLRTFFKAEMQMLCLCMLTIKAYQPNIKNNGSLLRSMVP